MKQKDLRIDHLPQGLEEELIRRWWERIKRGFLHLIILHLFQIKGDNQEYSTQTGIQLKQIIMNNTYDHWQPSPGSIYPILAELEQDGLIQQVKGENKKNKVYRITLKGITLSDLIQKSSLLFGGSFDHFAIPQDKDSFEKQFLAYLSEKSVKELTELQNHFLFLAELCLRSIREKMK